MKRCSDHVHDEDGTPCPVELALKRVSVRDSHGHEKLTWRASTDPAVQHHTKPNPKLNPLAMSLQQEKELKSMITSGVSRSQAKSLWGKRAQETLAEVEGANDAGTNLSATDLTRLQRDARQRLDQLDLDPTGKVYFDTMWSNVTQNMNRKRRRQDPHATTGTVCARAHAPACTSPPTEKERTQSVLAFGARIRCCMVLTCRCAPPVSKQGLSLEEFAADHPFPETEGELRRGDSGS